MQSFSPLIFNLRTHSYVTTFNAILPDFFIKVIPAWKMRCLAWRWLDGLQFWSQLSQLHIEVFFFFFKVIKNVCYWFLLNWMFFSAILDDYPRLLWGNLTFMVVRSILRWGEILWGKWIILRSILILILNLHPRQGIFHFFLFKFFEILNNRIRVILLMR